MHAYSDRINHAFAFAAKHHRGPGSASPGSLGHPANVAVILARYGCDQPTIVAGILHHSLEDAYPEGRRELIEGKVAEKFGPVVLAIARDACEPKYGSRGEERPWRACKHDFLAHLAVAEPRALDIIAADEIHRCGSTIAALRRLGAEYLGAVSRANSEETIWWYRSMTEVLASRPDWPQRAMLEEIRALGADLVRNLRETEEEM